jgi:hypothetical protein
MTSQTMRPPSNTSEMVRRRIAESREVMKAVLRSPEAAHAHLVKLGIVTKDGKLTQAYTSK